MTAPVPSAWSLPIAALFNDLVAWLNTRLAARVTELETELAAETSINQRLKEGAP